MNRFQERWALPLNGGKLGMRSWAAGGQRKHLPQEKIKHETDRTGGDKRDREQVTSAEPI